MEKNYWRDLWRYRELFQVLAWRDISVRYKQTVAGVAWALIRPFVTIAVLTVVFGKLAQLPSDGNTPYPLMVFAGMLPWMFLSSTLSDASNSLINSANLISKVYFPRLIVPAATICAGLIDLAISFVALLILMAWYLYLPGPQILLFPLFVLLAIVSTLGPSLWISAVNVRYRDFRHLVPFAIQIGFYASPVGFSSNVIPEQYRLWYSLNPIVGIIDGFRWCILGNQSPLYFPGLLVSITFSILFLALGIRRFRKVERQFADLI